LITKEAQVGEPGGLKHAELSVKKTDRSGDYVRRCTVSVLQPYPAG